MLRPDGAAVWDRIRGLLGSDIAATGVRDAYFPLLVPVSFFAKEADHVAGFAKEAAVVTHYRLQAHENAGRGGVAMRADPTAELEEPYVVRPTSETVIWWSFQRWIQSAEDLPMEVNQWANVLRWEMVPRPFLRTAEFLWQEGHTAHADAEGAVARQQAMLQLYAHFAQHALAMPTIRGEKSAGERFAGADSTLTMEAHMQNGWALQAATSHFLGQNFSKAFDVQALMPDGSRQHVWATSWGASTRLIGGALMAHSDDVGVVLPPRVAPAQVVVIPIPSKKAPAEDVLRVAHSVAADLRAAHPCWRVEVDTRTDRGPGARFFEHERRGVPLRVEIGARELANGSLLLRPRDCKERAVCTVDTAADSCAVELQRVHTRLWQAAAARLHSSVYWCTSKAELLDIVASRRSELSAPAAAATPTRAGECIDSGNDQAWLTELAHSADAAAAASLPQELSNPWLLVPWGGSPADEEQLQRDTKMTLRCLPLAPGLHEWAAGHACAWTGKPATHAAIIARAF